MTLAPPGWQRKWSMSARRNPWRPRKSSRAGRKRARMMAGISRENCTLKPSSSTRQPITWSDPGQVCSPQEARAGPSPSVLTRAAAAPSPKSAVATRLLLLWSARRKVRPQSSTTVTSTLDPGRARAMAAARASPRTPPAQPSPKMGSLCRSRRIPTLSASRASRLGVAMPDDDTEMMVSTSVTSSPAPPRQSRAAVSMRVTALSR